MMQQAQIQSVLQAHQPFNATEAVFLTQTIGFVEKNVEFWQRTTLAGHLTGSAWIISPDRTQVLLIHHAKLDRWFQPGGHAEPSDYGLLHTARREALEECGLSAITLLQGTIFDIDIHPIPAKGDVPEHLHYDIRYLFEADPNGTYAPDTSEIKDLAWVNIAELKGADTPDSLRRMALKLAIPYPKRP